MSHNHIYTLFGKSVATTTTAAAITELSFMSKILNYTLNKNYAGQVTFLQHTLSCSYMWTCARRKKIYDFIKIGEFFRSLKYLFWSLRARKKIRLLFAADAWHNPGETKFFFSNVCDLRSHSYFNTSRRMPGDITNNWWFDFLPNKSIENVIPGSVVIVLPNLEHSINTWRESQVNLLPLLSIGPANRNIIQQSTYTVYGDWNSLVKQLFFCRFLTAL